MMIHLFVFWLGASLGSLYHVIGYRQPQGLNWVSARSCCPHCQKVLNWYELLPLFSYLCQRGRCRTCQAPINSIYFWVEILSGFLFLFPLIHGQVNVIVAWIFLSLLLIITVSDLYYGLILNKVLLFFLPLLWLNPHRSIIGMLTGFFLLIANFVIGKLLFKRATLGGGDIKLYGLVGLVLGGIPTVISLMLAGVLALGYALITRQNKEQELPFGPFIATASYICLFYGHTLWEFFQGHY